MEITQSLIEKFFKDQCTSEEASLVAEFLRDHPDVAARPFRNDWSAVSKQRALSVSEKLEMLEQIKMVAYENGDRRKRNYVFLLSAAASIVLLLCLWGLIPANNEMPTATHALAKIDTPNIKKSNWVTQYNSGSYPMQYRLPDSSLVTLSAGAEIKYLAELTQSKRDIYLSGEGVFEVMKDSARAFSVYAGKFSVTALGTVFKVCDSKSFSEVKLLEGRIVIKSTDKQLTSWKKDLFLKPGESMKFDKNTRTVRFTSAPKLKVQEKTEVDENLVFQFENAPLTDVFIALTNRFRQHIEFDKDLVAEKYFSGSVLKSDSLEVILNVIARMNALAVEKTENGFLIKKLP